MTEVELDQFLVDPQPVSSTIVIDANWLQSQLKQKHKLENELKLLKSCESDKQELIDVLKDKAMMYKEMLDEYRKMRVLKVYV